MLECESSLSNANTNCRQKCGPLCYAHSGWLINLAAIDLARNGLATLDFRRIAGQSEAKTQTKPQPEERQPRLAQAARWGPLQCVGLATFARCC